MTRDEAIKESRAAGLELLVESVGDAMDIIVSALIDAFPDKEERDDILRRQAGILSQFMTAAGATADNGVRADG